MSLSGIIETVKSYYDRILAFLVLVVLFVSALQLGVSIGTTRMKQQQFDAELKNKRPRHPVATPVDTAVFEKAIEDAASPTNIMSVGWSNRILVPELRVSCIDCGKAITYDAALCPFCGTDQIIKDDIGSDRDSDGMPDLEFEKKFNLDPRDPSDADKDPDNDGFTNLEECRWNTSPRDPADHPPYIAKLRLDEITSEPFHLLFMSVTKSAGGDLVFALNLRDVRTYFKKLNDQVESFKIAKYEEKVEGTGTTRKDISELTLQGTDKTVVLVKGQRHTEYTYVAKFTFSVDGSVLSKKVGDTIELRGQKSKVMSIDSDKRRVLLVDLKTAKESWLEQAAPSEPKVEQPDQGTGAATER